MTAETSAPTRYRRTVDVSLEARARRWTIDQRDGHAAFDDQPSDEAPDGLTRVSYGQAARVAVFAGPDPDLERVLRRAVLASGAELVLYLRTTDERGLIERATALRDARVDLALALIAHRGDADGVVDLIEALRLGCADRRPAPRIVVAGEPHAALRAKAAAVPFVVELLPDPRRPEGITAFAHRCRELRRGTDHSLILRDEALEELARLVGVRGVDALIVDLSGGSTSLVRADARGGVAAVHVAPLGSGVAADRTVGRAGLDGVRRWIPWSIDAPSMLERVFNRARWPDAVAAEASALALEIALAHEALSHALADAAACGILEPLRDAPLTIVTGAAASFARAAHTALVAIDGLASPMPTTLYRDADGALVAIGAFAARLRAESIDPTAMVSEELTRRLTPLAFVVPATPARRSKLRVNGAEHFGDELVPGAFFSVRHRGLVEVQVTATSTEARGTAGELGIIVDARGRPLVLPPRDAERIPTLVRWFAALDLAVASVA